MNFNELMKADNNRNKTYMDFEKSLNQFRLKYNPQCEFDLNYSDNEHLIILTENLTEYTRDMHKDLCQSFNVKLIAVNRLKQQLANKTYLTIEYIYEDRDSLKDELKWESIRL